MVSQSRASRFSRRTLLAAAAAGALGLLAACAQTPAPTSAPTPSQAPSSASTPAPTAPPAKQPAAPTAASDSGGRPASSGASGDPNYAPTRMEGTTITLWSISFEPHKVRYTDMLAGLEKYTGIKGKVETQDGNFTAKLVAAMATGLVPDVVSSLGRAIPPYLKEDAILPVDDEVYKALGVDPNKWFTPGSIGAFWHEGRFWGVPWEDNQVASGYGARLDFLREDNLESEWPASQGRDAFESYEEVWDLAKKLQKESGGSVSRWGLSSAGWLSKSVFGVMKMLGTDWWDPDKKQFNMNSEAGVRALELLAEIPSQQLKIEGELSMSGRDATMQGKVAIGRSTVSMVPLAKDQGIEVETVMAPPAEKGGTVLYVGEGGWGAIIPKQAKNRDAAFEFLRYGTTYEGQFNWAKTALPVPAVVKMGEDAIYQGDDFVHKSVQRWIKASTNTIYMGSGFGNEGTISSAVEAVGTEIRSGKLTAKDAAAKLQDEFERHYQEFYG